MSSAPGRAFWRRLAGHADLEFVTLDPECAGEPEFRAVNPLAARLLGAETSRAWQMLAIGLAEGTLTVAVCDALSDAGREAAARTGRPVRLVLAAEEDLARALDATFGRPPLPAPLVPDPGAAALLAEPLARRLGVVALGAGDGSVRVATAAPLVPEATVELRAATGLEPEGVLAPRREVEALLHGAYAAEHLALATGELRRRFPEESAHAVLSPRQRVVLEVLAVAVLAALLVRPAATLAALGGLAAAGYLAVLAHRCVLAWGSLADPGLLTVSAEELAALDDAQLPVYSVLVPLLREAAVVPRLVAGLLALDYPASRLDVRLLCEEGDTETIAALEELALPEHMTIVVVPDGAPRTKPKACAFGLLLARGELVVVFDAEDRPSPDQLRRAVAGFAKAGPAVACLQARLAHFNAEQNLLTRWFAAEFALWFDLVLPGLHRRGAPIPLGGTSNHLRADRLREVGGWDPYNVTEDADLGVRLHRAGLRTAMLDAVTLEEANSELGNWLRQRSRWCKGHLQTWLVHMRHPLRLAHQLGPGGLVAFHLTVGSVLIALTNPVFWALTTVVFLVSPHGLRGAFPHGVYEASLASLAVGNLALVLLHVAGALRRRQFGLVRHALFVPLAWGLLSLAAWKGAIQLATRPHYWEKTVHGLDDGEPA